MLFFSKKKSSSQAVLWWKCSSETAHFSCSSHWIANGTILICNEANNYLESLQINHYIATGKSLSKYNKKTVRLWWSYETWKWPEERRQGRCFFKDVRTVSQHSTHVNVLMFLYQWLLGCSRVHTTVSLTKTWPEVPLAH